MLSRYLFVSLLFLCFVSPLKADEAEDVKDTYLKAGKAILYYLNNSEAGKKFVKKHSLSTFDLQKILNAKNISVKPGPLYDNRKSVVDTLGEKGLTILNQKSWDGFFQKEQDVYYLVFHEMLRMLEIDDDDYVISKELHPFPFQYKITTRRKFTPIDTSSMPHEERIAYSRNRFETIKKLARDREMKYFYKDMEDFGTIFVELDKLLPELKTDLAPRVEVKLKTLLNGLDNTLNRMENLLRERD